ncbi:MAG: PIN domain-containing protein [Acidobacteria bacterium]|nr:PIN domain-containing protein [Acidobacteriota bacterium]
MIAVDTNVLVYAHRQDTPYHKAAALAIKRLAEGTAPWGIPWPCVHEFLSVSTNPRIFKPPSPPAIAIQQVEIWMESPTLRILGESTGYWNELRGTFLAGKLAGAQVHDARIHAICRASGVSELWSADRDFSRMRGLKIVNSCLD